MAQNPYESPRPGEPFDDRAFGDSGSIRQLLTEIRDAQHEMLQIQREAMLRTRRTMRFSYVGMILPLLLLPLFLLYLVTRVRAIPQIPARPAPRALP